MQRFLFVALTAVLALYFIASTHALTDFCGTWKMDPSRSESAHQAVPIGLVTLVIKQTPAEVSIETRKAENNKSAISSETLTYRLDGAENTTGAPEAPIKAKAHWNGAKLVTETVRTLQGSTFTTKYVLSLDASGREMTIDKTLTIQHGYQAQQANNIGTGKDVFVKKKGQAK